ncbi:MAG: DUF547 domain-containing protein [Pseudomonadota bacterium]
MTVSHQAVAQFGPAPIEQFAEYDAASKSSIAYDSVDTILEAFVVADRDRHVVRYGVIKGQGQRVIESLVAGFEKLPVSKLNRDEQLAYWLNLRTLMVIHATSSAYPSANPKSLLASNSGFLNTQLITISGQDLSIKDVDNILLTHWKDEPNLVFGLIVPAAGSPDFPTSAFTGAEVHQQLEQAGRDYINRKDVVKAKKGKVTLSEFLVWHQDHFGGETAMVAHIRALAQPKLASKWADMASVQSRFDWKLNALRERSLASGAAGRRGGGFEGGGFGGNGAIGGGDRFGGGS